MALNPLVQKQAQHELDTVVGDARLVSYSDRQHMPYLDCLLSEILRYACCHNLRDLRLRTSGMTP